MKHNWERILSIIKEIGAGIAEWEALARAIAARTGHMPRKTLTDGLRRELERSFASPSELAAFLNDEDENTISPLASAMLDHLRGRGGRDVVFSAIALSDRFDRSPSSVLSAAEELHAAGYNIVITEGDVTLPAVLAPSFTKIPVEVWTKSASVYRFGLVSDTHLANRCARLDTLNALYDLFEAEGIETVLHAGNLIDGEFKWNAMELVAHGVEGQIAFAAKNYPAREGMVTRFLSADDHEGWWAKGPGFDIGRHMENQFGRAGRDDLRWLGHMEVDLSLTEDPDSRAVLRIMHPGGGSSYATSYQIQKFAESWQGGEKPAVAIYGHYHKAGYFYPREVHSFLAACVEDQTIWMRKKKLAAHVGGWIIEIHITAMGGVGRVKGEFIPFYDRGYYASWDYSSMWE